MTAWTPEQMRALADRHDCKQRPTQVICWRCTECGAWSGNTASEPWHRVTSAHVTEVELGVADER